MPQAFILPSMTIVAMVLWIASTQAQDGRRFAPPQAFPDAMCRSGEADRLTDVDRVVCTDRTLVDKHYRLGITQRSLQGVVGFPRTLRFEQMHRTWLGDRVQCLGVEVTACLHRIYDARLDELTNAIALEKQGRR
jgi:hypothetical protein